jgi:NitT/TauT family transport system ATP-binding protein
LADAAATVELLNVGLRYGGPGGIEALQNTSMTLAAGEFVAVVGPSGCGKSSLMKLITGLLPASSGAIFVEGQRVTGPLKIVGMAFQNPTMLPWRTTLDNVMLPLEIVQPHRSRLRQDRERYTAAARELLRSVGLAGFEATLPYALSGGMQQRANLCRSLMHEPRLLMLDEPFGALDSFTREELWGVLQDLWMRRGFTCVLVTHDLREAAFLADRVFVMSARPATVLAVHRIDLPRPRTLDDTFTLEFTTIVHAMRDQIGRQRQMPRQGAAL